MKEIIERGTTSVIRHVFIQDSSSTTGAGLTALAHDTANLAGAYIRDGSTLATLTFETIATLGTYAAPTSNAHIRIKLLHDTNAPGLYEVQFHNDWFNTTGDKRTLVVMLFGAANMAPIPFEFQLCDPVRGVGSPTALPPVAAEAAGGMYTRGSGAGQINQAANGQVDGNVVHWLGQACAAVSVNGVPEVDLTHIGGAAASLATEFEADLTKIHGTALNETAGQLAAAFEKLFDVATPVLVASDVMVGTNGAAVAAAWTAARAGYLDNLNIGENVAGTSEVTSIQNNTRCVRVVPTVIERPDSGSTTYRIELLLYDDTGNMEAPDSAPTITLVDESGNDRSARLDSATMTLVSTGRYRAVYTASDSDDLEQLVWAFSVVEGSNTRIYGNTTLVVDTTAVDFTAADRTKLEGVHGKLPSADYLLGGANANGSGYSTHDAAAVVTALGTGSTLTACLTAAGFSTHDAVAVVTALGTGSTLTACLTAAGFSTHDAAAVVTALGTGSTLTSCLTAAGFSTHDAAAVVTAMQVVAADFKADVEALALEATLTAMKGDGWTTETLKAIYDAGGGDATAANQTVIVNHLLGIKGASWSDETLKVIKAAIDAIVAGVPKNITIDGTNVVIKGAN